MFGNNEENTKRKNKGMEGVGTDLNLIGVGTSISGDINSSGDLRIDGNVRGNVQSKARIVLGPNGKIEGDIHAQNADIQGSVKGKLMIGEILFLKSTAQINGDIVTNKLVVESGAEFNGNCIMKSGSRIVEETGANEIRRPKTEQAAV
ncbi:MAG: polymer-forming cytoskeletal protein [Bacteroidota bacterium]|nr:polymer-forming cytoskeletal protein [Bacteroidota bacterium]MDX5430709.1 polymer-forming cytoskeletal protein [Bacteroidota bacterium]MDX5469456.1 polymer-forming cytoskeletal protein [Bacteroidota bacterium]